MCTVELVAPTEGLAAECKRSFVDMVRTLITVVDEPWIVGGGGSVPIEISVQLTAPQQSEFSSYAPICRRAFCEAVMVIPLTLAMNAGLDAVKLVQDASAHHPINHWTAVNLDSGNPADMLALGVIEPLATFREGLSAALAIVELVLKTDKNILAPPREEIT